MKAVASKYVGIIHREGERARLITRHYRSFVLTLMHGDYIKAAALLFTDLSRILMIYSSSRVNLSFLIFLIEKRAIFILQTTIHYLLL